MRRVCPSFALGALLGVLVSACGGGDATDCDPPCGAGSVCQDGFCTSACPLGCGFNERCVDANQCALADGMEPPLPASCGDGATCVVGLFAGQDATCAALEDGSLWCWGDGSDGKLGRGATSAQTRPVEVTGLGGAAVSVGFGADYTCAARADGAVACWGQGPDWQLEPVTDPTTPTVLDEVPLAAAVASGDSHVCALTLEGTVVCWGANSRGQLGAGDTAPHAAAVAVAGLANVTELAAGTDYTCAVHDGGVLSCWGGNDAGQLGDTTTETRPGPVAVIAADTAEVQAGSKRTCARAASGGVSCWGESLIVEVTYSFDGSDWDFEWDPIEDWLAPTPMRSPEVATGLAVGRGHTCALLPQGLIGCWGLDTSGQLGNWADSEQVELYPVRAATSAASAVAAGLNHSCAALIWGGVACWGDNDHGQLGDGSTAMRTSPAYVVW